MLWKKLSSSSAATAVVVVVVVMAYFIHYKPKCQIFVTYWHCWTYLFNRAWSM